MNSAWICTATGGLQFMQATDCCCPISNSKNVAVVRGRNKSIAELLFGVMDRLKSDTEGGFSTLPVNDGTELDGHYKPFQLASVLTALCQFATPEVVAFLKENPSGPKMEQERLELMLTSINPGASLSLPEC